MENFIFCGLCACQSVGILSDTCIHDYKILGTGQNRVHSPESYQKILREIQNFVWLRE